MPGTANVRHFFIRDWIMSQLSTFFDVLLGINALDFINEKPAHGLEQSIQNEYAEQVLPCTIIVKSRDFNLGEINPYNQQTAIAIKRPLDELVQDVRRKLHFSAQHPSSTDIMMDVIDEQTGEIIRQQSVTELLRLV